MSTWVHCPVRMCWSHCSSTNYLLLLLPTECLFPPYVHDVSEGSIAESSCFTAAQKNSTYLHFQSHVPSAQLPSSAAQGQPDDHRPECCIRTQSVPYMRSKIKVRGQYTPVLTRECVCADSACWVCSVSGFKQIALSDAKREQQII